MQKKKKKKREGERESEGGRGISQRRNGKMDPKKQKKIGSREEDYRSQSKHGRGSEWRPTLMHHHRKERNFFSFWDVSSLGGLFKVELIHA